MDMNWIEPPTACESAYVMELKVQENGPRIGRNAVGTWEAYMDVDGGGYAIGYGHRLNPRERLPASVTDAHVAKLLMVDVWKAMWKAAAQYGKGWAQLPEWQQLLWADIQYNVGTIKGWPRLRKALAEGALERARKEYLERRYTTPAGRYGSLRNRAAAVWRAVTGCR